MRIVIGNDHLYVCGICSVFNVALQKLVSSRNYDGADSVECRHQDPPFIAAAEDEHYSVTFLDSL